MVHVRAGHRSEVRAALKDGRTRSALASLGPVWALLLQTCACFTSDWILPSAQLFLLMRSPRYLPVPPGFDPSTC
ncbi:hypothetical protein JZ751_005842 [Albula glossodonta]|uniref:Uncharacterized protein n=1 Tax=Albula glossodonta TaxID=121402 RepID=A0A8T2P2W8_9TELE|nr:hypothetical protein JZ751_005842 [Albula glossodonta]